LVDQSLLVPVEASGETRYAMLETIREFALEQLEACGEADITRRRHSEAFLALAERAEAGLRGSERAGWIERLEAEHPNLRAALAFAEESDDATLAQRLVAALFRFWEAAGHLSEGRGWVARVLALGVGEPTAERALSLGAAATLAYRQGDYDQAEAYSEERLAIWRALGDEAGIAAALNLQGAVAYDHGDYQRAVDLFEAATVLQRKVGDASMLGVWLSNVGQAARELGDLTRAEAAHREALGILRSLDDREGIAYALNGLGMVAHRRGDLTGAVRQHEEALALRQVSDPRTVAVSLANLGAALRDQGDLAGAADRYRESLRLRWERGERRGVVESLAGLASIAARCGQHMVAARLRGAFDAAGRAGDVAIAPHHLGTERVFGSARAALGQAAWKAAWEAGREMTLEQAVSEAHAFDTAAPSPATGDLSPAARLGAALSPREREVLRLLAEGRNDRDIGKTLGISHRTVMNHVASILAKLGVDSRTSAASYAFKHGLV
jgi:non-specific serine/threonine protein kinase